MPFIVSRVSIPTDSSQKMAIKEGYGKLIELIPGKTESRVVLAQEDNIWLAAAGKTDIPIAFIEVNVLNSRSHAGYQAFSRAITDLYEQVLGIPAANVYIKYVDMPGISKDGVFQEETL